MTGLGLTRWARAALVTGLLAPAGRSASSDRTAAGPEGIEVVPASTLDHVPAPIADALHQYGPFADEAGLSAWVATDPPVVVFTALSEADARWLGSLIALTDCSFRARYAVTEQDCARPRSAYVAFHFTTSKDYDRLLSWLVSGHDYLASWAPTVRGGPGFVIYQPALFALLEGAQASRDNLVVHLAGHAALYRFCNVQPFWLREAVAMDLEVTLLDQLFPGCGAGGFVGRGTPERWRTDLGTAWKSATPETIDAVLTSASVPLGHTERLRALGLVRGLVERDAPAFRRFLAELVADREAHRSRDPFHLSDDETQRRLLDACFRATPQPTEVTADRHRSARTELASGWRDEVLELIREDARKPDRGDPWRAAVMLAEKNRKRRGR